VQGRQGRAGYGAAWEFRRVEWLVGWVWVVEGWRVGGGGW